MTLFVPTYLRCEWLVTPLGIDTLAPRLSWELCSLDNLSAADQFAYRVSVATTPALLQAGIPDIWETGRVSSAEQALTYAGPALTSGARYFWHVEVWDQNGEVSASNEPSWWEMGLLAPGDWEADWIHLPLAVPANNPCTPPRYLRRPFSASREVQRARLYITAKGLYEATLNGQRVGNAWLTPGWTDYDERVQYQTYDVSELIARGENVLGVILGSGWYSGHISNSGPYFYGSSPQLLAQLELEYSDGTIERVVSDEQWRASTGPLIMADLLKGETYDARREEEGWDRPHFADLGWQAVTLLPQKTSPRLVADCAQPV
ncbi:MAG TPA: alpha-L-rhamnosidase N-terminal domain-containing protein, partial [Ktedonobacteraceae bacterium]|nr:alpha-L-rhamnosidase N-terminal domain-containing protein [Ktedonobacteraceae bacterium]